MNNFILDLLKKSEPTLSGKPKLPPGTGQSCGANV